MRRGEDSSNKKGHDRVFLNKKESKVTFSHYDDPSHNTHSILSSHSCGDFFLHKHKQNDPLMPAFCADYIVIVAVF